MANRGSFLAACAAALAVMAAPAPARAQVPLQPAPAVAWEGVAAELDAARAALHVPAMAVVVVADGRVALARGLGQLGLENSAPADANTRFAIASCTKAFTALALAMLQEEGRLTLTDSVAAHDPLLQLPSREAQAALTIADLLSQRSGLARHDFMWHARPAMTRAAFAAAQADLPMQRQPGRAYGYTNTAYILAGRLVDLEAGQSWEDFTAARIFAPLGMTRSNFSSQGLAQDANAAIATKRSGGRSRTVPWRDSRLLGPAGAINSTAHDMGRWLLLLTGDGAIDGRRIIQPDTLEALFTPAGPTRPSARNARQPGFSTGYALGWRVDAWRGQRRVSHGGAVDGFRARVAVFPDRGVGVAVMVNLGPSQLPDRAARVLAERALGLPPTINLLAVAAAQDKAEQAAEDAPSLPPRGRLARLDTQDPMISPTIALEAMHGVYAHPAYGPISIKPGDDPQSLRIVFGALAGRLEHWRENSFIAFSDAPDDSLDESEIVFQKDAGGAVTGFTAMIDNQLAPIVFVRRGPLAPRAAPAQPPAQASLTVASRREPGLALGLLALAGVIVALAGWTWARSRGIKDPA